MFSSAMQIWRLNINPASDDDVDPRRFSLDNDILGFAWPIEGDSDEVTWEEYEEKAEKKYGGKSWSTATNALYNRMEIGDLCWTRDHNGSYYLGEVTGPWRYEARPEHRNADIVNVRDCQWEEVGSPDAVPGKVINSLNVGGTLQRVNGDTIKEYSSMLYSRLTETGEEEHAVDADNIFSLLHPEDCEDLIGLYLQENDYRLIPSTCKTGTAKYEYVLKHQKTGQKAHAQVKRGDVSLDAEEYRSLDGTVFLFTSDGDQRGEASNVKFIDPSTIQNFMQENRQILPDRVVEWTRVLS
jgi:hypothetical protein